MVNSMTILCVRKMDCSEGLTRQEWELSLVAVHLLCK